MILSTRSSATQASLPVVQYKADNGFILSVPLKLNHQVLQEEPSHNHDQDLVKHIVDTCRNGANIGYEGPHRIQDRDNWPLAYTHAEVIEKAIVRDLSGGSKVGPFHERISRLFPDHQ